MLLYKIDEEDKVGNMSGNYKHMINLIREDYRNFFKASEYLQNRYDFCLEAIYSCLSEVNHMSNKKIAYEVLKDFLNGIKKINGINMQIINNGQFYVKEKPKVKKYKLRRAI